MLVLIEPSGAYLSCLVCRGTRFRQREVLMNTSGATMFGFDWANKSGDGAICAACGFVHTFMGPGHRWVDPGSVPEAQLPPEVL
ncbi:hypothetical protein [Tsukamurella strandjordii]|uniref:DNA-binding protein n=1 Tax=Tsukamurella strandjordii TaxID=147577 RepID=A0AA90SSF6_9ACTN|nr:hypothetical protein [Tsukamurella strandjordii]MDP0399861.1 hypothetical protein [Tsukamurella strandjordii]